MSYTIRLIHSRRAFNDQTTGFPGNRMPKSVRRKIIAVLNEIMEIIDSCDDNWSWHVFWLDFSQDILNVDQWKIEEISAEMIRDQLRCPTTTDQHVLKVMDSAFDIAAAGIRDFSQNGNYRAVQNLWDRHNDQVNHINNIFFAANIGYCLMRWQPRERYSGVRLVKVNFDQALLEQQRASIDAILYEPLRRRCLRENDLSSSWHCDEQDPLPGICRRQKKFANREKALRLQIAAMQDGKVTVFDRLLADIHNKQVSSKEYKADLRILQDAQAAFNDELITGRPAGENLSRRQSMEHALCALFSRHSVATLESVIARIKHFWTEENEDEAEVPATP